MQTNDISFESDNRTDYRVDNKRVLDKSLINDPTTCSSLSTQPTTAIHNNNNINNNTPPSCTISSIFNNVSTTLDIKKVKDEEEETERLPSIKDFLAACCYQEQSIVPNETSPNNVSNNHCSPILVHQSSATYLNNMNILYTPNGSSSPHNFSNSANLSMFNNNAFNSCNPKSACMEMLKPSSGSTSTTPNNACYYTLPTTIVEPPLSSNMHFNKMSKENSLPTVPNHHLTPTPSVQSSHSSSLASLIEQPFFNSGHLHNQFGSKTTTISPFASTAFAFNNYGACSNTPTTSINNDNGGACSTQMFVERDNKQQQTHTIKSQQRRRGSKTSNNVESNGSSDGSYGTSSQDTPKLFLLSKESAFTSNLTVNNEIVNNNDLLPSLIEVNCSNGFTITKDKKFKYSVFVNDSIIIKIPNQQGIVQLLYTTFIELRVATNGEEEFYYSYDGTILESRKSFLDYYHNFQQAKQNNQTANDMIVIELPIKRDNSSRRSKRKAAIKNNNGAAAKTFQQNTPVQQQCSKKLCFVQFIDENNQVLLRSETIWCKSKTREEMERKKIKDTKRKRDCSTKQTITIDPINTNTNNVKVPVNTTVQSPMPTKPRNNFSQHWLSDLNNSNSNTPPFSSGSGYNFEENQPIISPIRCISNNNTTNSTTTSVLDLLESDTKKRRQSLPNIVHTNFPTTTSNVMTNSLLTNGSPLRTNHKPIFSFKATTAIQDSTLTAPPIPTPVPTRTAITSLNNTAVSSTNNNNNDKQQGEKPTLTLLSMVASELLVDEQ
ncbi:hypothetical protein ABK040_014081 [Willaertia magna]